MVWRETGQNEHKAAAQPRLTYHFDAAIMRLGNPLHNRQPQTAAMLIGSKRLI